MWLVFTPTAVNSDRTRVNSERNRINCLFRWKRRLFLGCHLLLVFQCVFDKDCNNTNEDTSVKLCDDKDRTEECSKESSTVMYEATEGSI